MAWPPLSITNIITNGSNHPRFAEKELLRLPVPDTVLKVQDKITAKIKDATGTMDLTLWNNDVDLVEKGEALKLTDGWCKEWNGNLQASTGKSGKIEKL